MKTIIFCKEGEAISEFIVEEKVKEFINSNLEEWKISTHLPIDIIRVYIKEKIIAIDDYSVMVEDIDGIISEFKIDKDGRSGDWCSTQDMWSNFIIRLL